MKIGDFKTTKQELLFLCDVLRLWTLTEVVITFDMSFPSGKLEGKN